jgi:hypothetical protein
MPLGIGTAGHAPGHLVLGDVRRRLLEVSREGKLHGELAGDRGVRPPLVGGLPGIGLVLGPAHVDLGVPGLPRSSRPVEGRQDVLLGGQGDDAVTDPPGQLRSPVPLRRHQDRWGWVREVVDPGLLDGVVPAPVALAAALPQEPDHLDGLLQHLQPLIDRRPPIPQDVLVQVLPGPHAEHEPPLEQHRAGGRGMGHHGGMDPDRRARHPGADPDPLGGLRQPTEDRPHERAVPLPVHPRVVVIGDHHEVEAGRLGAGPVSDQVPGAVLLAR